MSTRQEQIIEKLKNLIFTASKLWDEVKPIKDTDIMTVTHPTIEEAKELLHALESSNEPEQRSAEEILEKHIHNLNYLLIAINEDVVDYKVGNKLMNLLKQEIKAMEQFSSLRQHQEGEWISVKDKPPVTIDDYWSDQVIINVVHDGIDHSTSGRTYNGEWYYTENLKKISNDFIVTHWMPLPNPPKAQK